MADQSEIDEVADMLGSSADANGWDAAKIGALLDGGETAMSIARRYWESRMAETSELADVTESGSTRRLSQIHSSAASMAAYYRGAEASEDPENQPGNYSFSREIRRV